MPYPEIPMELWRRKETAPHHRTSANQWGEHGYFVVDGVVHTYTIDRKEQYDQLLDSRTVEEVLAGNAPEELKSWLRGLKASG